MTIQARATRSLPTHGLELDAWDGLQLRLVPIPRPMSAARSRVVMSTPQCRPTLTVTNSLSPGRRSFTALHELGHHLQKNNIALAYAVRSQPADADAFEDAACDAFAARVLITDDMLEAVLTDRSPSAATLVRLFEETQASRAACCARVVDHLGASGVARRIRQHWPCHVRPRARRRDRACTGNRPIGFPLIKAALASSAGAQRDRTYFTYRSGSRSSEMYGDAAWAGDYLMVVAVLDRPGWKAFAPSRDLPRTYVPGSTAGARSARSPSQSPSGAPAAGRAGVPSPTADARPRRRRPAIGASA